MTVSSHIAANSRSSSITNNVVRILWTDVDESPHRFPDWASPQFPSGESFRIGRFVREPDRRLRYAAVALGCRLIADTYGIDAGVTVYRDSRGRPCLISAGDADISFSHSGDIVVCALSSHGRIGIDIEQIRPVDPEEFRSFFPAGLVKDSGGETMFSCGKRTGYQPFFDAWTRLESVIKADGRGFGSSFGDLVFENDNAFMDGHVWRLKPVIIADGYVCHLASAFPVDRCTVDRAERFMQDGCRV